MAAKRKAPKKSQQKAKRKKPAVKKIVRKKAPAKRPAAKPAGMSVKTDPALEARLRMLATRMGSSLDALIVQALNEFADNWEDHLQTVAALQNTQDRVHLSVLKK